MMKGKFITFEGGEGSGKSTQSKLLCKYLIDNNIETLWTREIGGTDVCEDIRKIVVHSDLLARSELLLIMAARYEHINKVIFPAITSGKYVVCDRFVDSSAAYQAGLSGFTIGEIYDLHNHLMQIMSNKENNNLDKDFINSALIPDITFLLNIDPMRALSRSISSGEINKFEEKNIDFHKKVYNNFNEIAKLHSERIVKIDCHDEEINDIHNKILSVIKSKNFI